MTVRERTHAPVHEVQTGQRDTDEHVRRVAGVLLLLAGDELRAEIGRLGLRGKREREKEEDEKRDNENTRAIRREQNNQNKLDKSQTTSQQAECDRCSPSTHKNGPQ